MVGKSIPASDDTYIHDAELRKDFIKVSSVLRLKTQSGASNSEKVEQMEDAIAQLQRESRNWKTIAETLDKRNQELETKIEDLSKNLEETNRRLQEELERIKRAIDIGKVVEEAGIEI